MNHKNIQGTCSHAKKYHKNIQGTLAQPGLSLFHAANNTCGQFVICDLEPVGLIVAGATSRQTQCSAFRFGLLSATCRYEDAGKLNGKYQELQLLAGIY